MIFQLYRVSQFYWWRKPEYPEITTDLSQVTDKVVSSTSLHNSGYSDRWLLMWVILWYFRYLQILEIENSKLMFIVFKL